jgi:hypothetical protein
MRSSSSGGAALAGAGPTSARARVAIATACSTKHKNLTQPNTKIMPNRPNTPKAKETFFWLRRPLSSQGDTFTSRGLLKTFPVKIIRRLLRKPLPRNIKRYVLLRRPLSSQGSPTFFAQAPPFCQGISLGPSQGK